MENLHSCWSHIWMLISPEAASSGWTLRCVPIIQDQEQTRKSHLKAQPSPAAPLVCEHKQTYYAIKQMFTVKIWCFNREDANACEKSVRGPLAANETGWNGCLALQLTTSPYFCVDVHFLADAHQSKDPVDCFWIIKHSLHWRNESIRGIWAPKQLHNMSD